MRLSQAPPSLLSLLLVLLAQTDNTSAGALPLEEQREVGFFNFLQPRQQCVAYCGYNSYCCTQGQGCFTTTGIAGCTLTAQGVVATAPAAGYGVYTTTFTETDLILRTSTYTSASPTQVYVAPPAPTQAPPAICDTSLGQTSCGIYCCAGFQMCASAGSCVEKASSWYPSVTYVAPVPTNSLSAPVKPTSGGVSTTTRVTSVTTTAAFLTATPAIGTTLPITEHNSSGGLSGGAIAGIVIGVIAAIIILLLICFCCIVKAGFDGILAIFGLGKKKRRSTERVEVTERYSRHGSGAGTASRRDTHTGWFGGSRPNKVSEKRKEKSGFGGLGVVGAGLLGLAAVLGLKRNHDKKEKSHRGDRSDISSSYYTDSFTGTSASSASSDRRTRESRGTRGTRR